MDHLYRFITGKKKEEGKTAAIYLTAITSFAIGAACGGQHALQLALYRILPRLALPAEKTGAVVGDGQLIVLFHKKSRPFRLIVAERT